MYPALDVMLSYDVVSIADRSLRNSIVVFDRGEIRVARRVAGIPGDRQLSRDPGFQLQKNGWWGFFSPTEQVAALFSLDTPLLPNQPSAVFADFSRYDLLIKLTYDEWTAAPAVGDSMYYLTADKSGFEDSSDWGLVHRRTFLGRIDPAAPE